MAFTRRQILKMGAVGLAVPTLTSMARGAAPAFSETALDSRLDEVLDNVALQEVAGAVLVVLRGGQPLYERAIGVADRERAVATRPDTVFRLASMTKGIVSATALVLVERGQLSLDDPVSRYLSGFRPATSNRVADAPRITVRQLLTHTSGLGYGVFQAPGNLYERRHISDGLDAPELSLQENLHRLAGTPLLATPGRKWIYSLGTDVLGAVLSAATGETLPSLVKRTVTEPLGMEDTAFVADTRLAPRLATPYTGAASGLRRVRSPDRVPLGENGLRLDPRRALSGHAYPSGGAGMIGTARDYTRFLEAVRLGGSRILRPETARLLVTNQIGDLSVEAAGPGWGWSLAFAVLLDPQKAGVPMARGTFQWGGVWGNTFWVDPARELTVVLLTNTTPAGMQGPLPDAVRAAIYAE